jgi:hypothetical protein
MPLGFLQSQQQTKPSGDRRDKAVAAVIGNFVLHVLEE